MNTKLRKLVLKKNTIALLQQDDSTRINAGAGKAATQLYVSCVMECAPSLRPRCYPLTSAC